MFLLGSILLVGCSTKRVYSPSAYPTSAPSARSGAQVIAKTLVIPTDPRQVVHEVAPMETVWRLSKMYGVDMDAIYKANHLVPGQVIKIGQKLTIPNAKAFFNVVNLYPNPQWRYIIIHHTATDIGNAILINKNHHHRGFWNGLGYHFLIDNGSLGKGDGQIEMSPRWVKQQVGAHCKAGGMNRKGIGIALVGNFNIEDPTPNQLRSLAYLIRTLRDYYRIPSNRIMGHRDVEGANTDCPGKRFPWPTLRHYLAKN